MLQLVGVLLLVGAMIIGGGVLLLSHQREARTDRDADAGKIAAERLKTASRAARAIATERRGSFLEDSATGTYSRFAEQLQRRDPKIGFVRIARGGKIASGGVYIVSEESSPRRLRLSSLIDLTGEDRDVAFSVTVRPDPPVRR